MDDKIEIAKRNSDTKVSRGILIEVVILGTVYNFFHVLRGVLKTCVWYSCGSLSSVFLPCSQAFQPVSCLFQMIQAIQVLRFHLLELEKVSENYNEPYSFVEKHSHSLEHLTLSWILYYRSRFCVDNRQPIMPLHIQGVVNMEKGWPPLTYCNRQPIMPLYIQGVVNMEEGCPPVTYCNRQSIMPLYIQGVANMGKGWPPLTYIYYKLSFDTLYCCL